MNEAFAEYSRAILSYRLGSGEGRYATAPASPGAVEAIVRQAGRAGRCLLLGVGRGDCAREVAGRLPGGCELTVCELYPEMAREHGRGLPLLADASPVALAWLLLSAGIFRSGAVCALNPEIADPQARRRFQTAQKLHAAFAPLEAGRASARPSLSLAAILHPDEPGLDGFFAALPAFATEAVVVWDAPEVPAALPPSPVPARHLAHPLENDFAAQRNRMLAACRGEWVLYLDCDERLDPALAALLPALLEQDECRSFAFPRLGLAPSGVKVGWGLWPDLQVRLFRPGPGVRFVRPVHERLEGLSGPTGLVVGAHIRHLSDLLKGRRELARKHALFDRAGGASGLHRQNPEYPTLPEEFFRRLTPEPLLGRWPETVRFLPL